VKLKGTVALGIMVGAMTVSIDAQNTSSPQQSQTPEPTIKLSKLLASNLSKVDAIESVSPQNAAKAYAKLLEGERHLWSVKNSRNGRNQALQLQNIRSARLAFQDAIAANPRLAEAYTALAELAITAPPTDVDEAIELANLSLKIEKSNFGSRRILARLYTFKSGLGTRSLDGQHTNKAVDEWKFVANLDPRNAEAWAFLAEFYERQEKEAERIDALEKWRSSATPVDSQFYQRMIGPTASLAPESAAVKLAEALLKSGRAQEAIDILSAIVADDPNNEPAIDLLRDSLSASTGVNSSKVVSALEQAVFGNPDNPALINLLTEAYARSGRLADAGTLLENAAKKAAPTDRTAAALYYVSLGEIYEGASNYDGTKKAYEKAISVRGLNRASTLADDERMFLGQVFERMIRAAKAANRLADATVVIDRARKLFGPQDNFADRQLVTLYRESGKRPEALTVIRKQRVRTPLDEALARQEATLLTELGRVDEAVTEYRKFMAAKPSGIQAGSSQTNGGPTTPTVDRVPIDIFSNLLFISSLYSQANRGKEAVETANQALAAARGVERKQIARLSIASALQMSGDMEGAEATLRDILKESPGNPIALNNLGYFLLERNERIEEALKLIEQAVSVDPTNPSYLDSLGWAYYKAGKLNDAEKHIKNALRYDPSSATINEHLGDIYSAQGKKDHAKASWQRAITIASDASDIERIKKKLEASSR